MELNEKLARWAGLTPDLLWDEQLLQWKTNKQFMLDPPNFTLSLDACFKWLVPKLGEYRLFSNFTDRRDHWAKVWSSNTHRDYVAIEDTPALALCKAIEQLIEETP